MYMDGKLIENGFAFIAFLGMMIIFIRQVLVILDRRLGQMIDKIDLMIGSHHEDQVALITALASHNTSCEGRCDRIIGQFSDHTARVAAVHQHILDLLGNRRKGTPS